MLYTPQSIADSESVSIWTARRVLKDFFPRHECGVWWRLNEDEFQYVREQIRNAKMLMPEQPRRVLKRSTPLLPFF